MAERAVRSARRPGATSAAASSPARTAAPAAPTQPALVPAVTPEWFEGKFDEVNFVQRLTRKIVVEQKSQEKSKGEFQTDQFVQAFAYTVDAISKLQDKTERKLSTAAQDTSAARTELSQSLTTIRDKFEKNFKYFHKLDKRINAVGHTAIRIGDRLEAVDNQRLRALESKEIIECFLALNSDQAPEADKLLEWLFAFKMDTSDYKIKRRVGDFKSKGVYHFNFDRPEAVHRYERVILAKKLWNIAQDLNIERLQKARHNCELLIDRLENYLLQKFDDASAGHDYSTMKEAAMMLFEFNGGESCIKHYILSLDMFLDPKKIQDDIDLALSSEGVSSDSFSSYDDSRLVDDPRLVGFFDGIKKTIADEYAVITKVFPQPIGIMKELVQRIFEQRITRFMDTVFTQIKTPLHFLRTLATAYSKCNEVVEALQALMMSDLNYELLVDSIFSSYRASYMEREVSSLSSIFESLLAEEAEERQKQEKRAQQQGGDSDQGTLLSLEMALNFIHASEEAAKRCVLVSWKSDVATNLVQLFVQLLKYLGYNYVNEVTGKAVHQLPVACIKSYAKTIKTVEGFYRLVYVVNQIVLFIQKHFHSDILPNVASANELTSCEIAKDKLLLELEQKVTHGLQKSLSATMSAIEKILYQKQKKSDFRLSESDATVSFNSVTEACAETIALMKQCHAFMSSTLDGQNLDVITNEFGRRAYKVLLEHFKGFTISQGAGGLQLLRDLTAYKECANKLFTDEGVLDQYETLRELANIHLVSADHLKVVLSESRLAKMDRNEVMQFIRLRSDYNRNWKL